MFSTERDQRLLILEQIIEIKKKQTNKQTEMAVKSVFAPNKNMLLTAFSFTFNLPGCVVTHFPWLQGTKQKYLSIMNLPMYTVVKIILNCLFWSLIGKGSISFWIQGTNSKLV